MVVNIHFTNAYVVDTYAEGTMTECNMKCCSSSSDTHEDKEKTSCCSDAYCTTVITSAHAINYSYSPEIPVNKSVKEFLPLVYNYTNLYTLSHTYDFWNPPKA